VIQKKEIEDFVEKGDGLIKMFIQIGIWLKISMKIF
jgi:hypothetical protein